jgi:hypothetical protein
MASFATRKSERNRSSSAGGAGPDFNNIADLKVLEYEIVESSPEGFEKGLENIKSQNPFQLW